MTRKKSAGRRLYESYVNRYDLDPREVEILEAACRTLDELVRVEALLDDTPTVVPGARGVQRANPLLDEVRRHRATLAALLSELRVEGDVAKPGISQSASIIALARWRREKAK